MRTHVGEDVLQFEGLGARRSRLQQLLIRGVSCHGSGRRDRLAIAAVHRVFKKVGAVAWCSDLRKI